MSMSSLDLRPARTQEGSALTSTAILIASLAACLVGLATIVGAMTESPTLSIEAEDAQFREVRHRIRQEGIWSSVYPSAPDIPRHEGVRTGR